MKTQLIIEGKKVGKWRASFLLFKEAWRFLRSDKELLLVPVFLLFFSAILMGGLTLITWFIFYSAPVDSFAKDSMSPIEYLQIFALYVFGVFSLAFAQTIAQAIIVHIVYVRAHGGNATLGSGIARAFSNWYPLFIWALIAGTIGIILRFVSERLAFVGKMVTSLLGASWSILTFFAVPVILIEQQKPSTAIATSARMFKENWGETLVSNVTLGLVFLLANIIVLVSFVGMLIFGASIQNGFLLIATIIGVVVWIILATLLNSALQGILKTLLYIYAAENFVPENFNRELLENMLVRKDAASPVAASGVSPMADVSSTV